LKYWGVPLGLGGGPEEEYSLVSEDWGHSEVEIEFEEGFMG